MKIQKINLGVGGGEGVRGEGGFGLGGGGQGGCDRRIEVLGKIRKKKIQGGVGLGGVGLGGGFGLGGGGVRVDVNEELKFL